MSEQPEQKREPPTPDRRGLDSSTWIWIWIVLLATLGVILWSAYAGLPSVGPRE